MLGVGYDSGDGCCSHVGGLPVGDGDCSRDVCGGGAMKCWWN